MKPFHGIHWRCMWEKLWESVASDFAMKVYAVLGALAAIGYLGSVVVAFLQRKRTKLREDLELLSWHREAGVEPPEVLVESVEKGKKELEPRPRLWSFSHLWTLVLIGFYWVPVSNGSFLGPWYLVFAQSLNTTMLLFLIFAFLNDIVWCRSYWYRCTRFGIWVNRQAKLPGDTPFGLSKRRQAVLLRDWRMGRIHPAYRPDEAEGCETTSD